MFLILCMTVFHLISSSSALRKKFMETREKTKETLNLEVYNAFISELRNNEKDQSVVTYCHYTIS